MMFQISIFIFKVTSTTRRLDSLCAVHISKTSLHKAANKTKATALRGANPFQRASQCTKTSQDLLFCCCQVPILT